MVWAIAIYFNNNNLCSSFPDDWGVKSNRHNPTATNKFILHNKKLLEIYNFQYYFGYPNTPPKSPKVF